MSGPSRLDPSAVVILGAARTPIGKFLGGLSGVPATELGGVAIQAAVKRSGADPELVDEVVMGQVLQAGAGQAPARQATLAAGLPSSASATTVNKVCASGLEAIHLAAGQIRAGEAELVVAGGMESMSRAPHLLPAARQGLRLGDGTVVDAAIHDGLWDPWENHHMGNAAELIAEKYGIGREEMDGFSLESHRKAVEAQRSGRFDAEIVPVPLSAPPKGRERDAGLVAADEGPRPNATMETLARLGPAFTPTGLVTAGNAPGLTDGAAAVVLSSAGFAERHGLRPLARILAHATAANPPRWLFDAPPLAIRRLLERTGTSLDDYDLLEVNEAFAAQVLANESVLEWDRGKLNVNGGAIALGHPIGATGARMVVTLLHALRQRGLRLGMAALCHGGGGAVAMSFELV